MWKERKKERKIDDSSASIARKTFLGSFSLYPGGHRCCVILESLQLAGIGAMIPIIHRPIPG
jgi:environmental stress-induced protein Ves